MLILTNAQIVTSGEVFRGTLVASEGKITHVDRGLASTAGAVDCEGDFVIPGLIDLHTDALERHHTPRAGVRWPVAAAIMAHDAQMAASGVSTVFDALAIGAAFEEEERLRDRVRAAIAELDRQEQHQLRAEHFLHLRLELAHPDTAAAFAEFADLSLLRMVSLMDHTPGQGQFADVERWRSNFGKSFGKSADEAEKLFRTRVELRERYAGSNRERIAEAVRERGLPLASHDDRTPEDVDCATSAGVTISEFPVTLEAAAAARDRGLSVLMGGPNVVLGGSHSGNAAAADVAANGWLDGLTSDYVPASMLHGAFLLSEQHGFPLPAAIAMVTSAPAAMVGLDDRGSLDPGLLADVVRVRWNGSIARVVTLWRAGARVV